MKIRISNKNKSILVILLLCILQLISYLLPFLNYTYKKNKYTISGFGCITGKTIAGGNAVITPSYILIASLAAIVVILVNIFLEGKIKEKLRVGLITIASFLIFIGNIISIMIVKGTLSDVKGVGIAYGNVVAIIVSILIVIYSLVMLRKEKILSALDFMVIPGMLYLLINNYIPMIGISIAFKKIDYQLGVFNSPWCGLDNFKILFAHTGSFFKSDAFIITRNTLLYNLVFIFLGMFMGIVVGICLADIFSRRFQKFFQTTLLLPQLISMVIVTYIVFALLSNEAGMVNKILGEGNEVNFYQSPKYWPFILIFISVWKSLGYNGIIFLSSIVGIDRSIYEACRVDGASKWQQIRYVTLPMLKPTVITLTLLSVGRIFYSDFGLFYQVPMDSGALYNVTNTIDTYVYHSLMVLNNISVSSAASTYQALVGFILVLTVNMIVRKLDKENALF